MRSISGVFLWCSTSSEPKKRLLWRTAPHEYSGNTPYIFNIYPVYTEYLLRIYENNDIFKVNDCESSVFTFVVRKKLMKIKIKVANTCLYSVYLPNTVAKKKVFRCISRVSCNQMAICCWNTENIREIQKKYWKYCGYSE